MKKNLYFVTALILLFNCRVFGQVTIGQLTPPDSSAVLQVIAPGNNKGVLLPQVTLTSSTDVTTVPNPAVGLLVYNTGKNVNFTVSGYLYWDGSEWLLINNGTANPAAIQDLNCGGASLTPASYTSGTPYNGVMQVPYSGGNGGVYSGGASYTANGLTFHLQPGTLAYGSGMLTFAVSGTPNVTSPSPTTVPLDQTMIPFWNGSCSALVGNQATADIKAIAVMDYMHFVAPDENGVYGFEVRCTTPDGLYSIRAFLTHNIQNSTATLANNNQSIDSQTNNNVQIKNNSSVTKVLMWNYSTNYGNFWADAGGHLSVPPNMWGGGQGNTWSSEKVNTAVNLAPWGNAGIYNASNNGPEYRIYSWIDTSTTTKVAYILTMMAGMDPGASMTDPTKQKVFIRIEQITAQ